MRDPQDFASAIKELRGKRTQREVAERAGIDPATWSAYEGGTRWPRSPGRFELIALGLEVHVTDLETLVAVHQRRRQKARAVHPEATPLEVEGPGDGVAINVLADDRAKAYIGETVSRVTSDLINLFAFLVVSER